MDQSDTVAVSGEFVSGRFELPSGGWVEFRDPKDLKGRDYKRVMRGIRGTDMEAVGAKAVDMLDGLIAIMIIKWEIPYLPSAPLPIDDILITDELELADLSALQTAVAPAYALVFGKTTGTGPGTPTRPASA